MKATFRVQFDVIIETESDEFADLQEFLKDVKLEKEELKNVLSEENLSEKIRHNVGFLMQHYSGVRNVKFGSTFSDKHKVSRRIRK